MTVPADVMADAGARVVFRAANGLREAPAWVALPRTINRDAAPVVVVHGISRDAEGIARLLAPRADALGRILVAPLFDKEAFPGYQRLDRKSRPDQALLVLMAALAADGLPVSGRFDLAGYSGGAQFAHRFTWLYPGRVGRLAVAAAGWWTFPDDAPYPYGIATGGDSETADRAALMRRNTPAFLARRIDVAVGAKDCVPDAATRSGRELDAQQGPDRLTRAWRWRRALEDAAERHGIEPQITMTVLPFCGHDFHACAEAGFDRLILPDASADLP